MENTFIRKSIKNQVRKGFSLIPNVAEDKNGLVSKITAWWLLPVKKAKSCVLQDYPGRHIPVDTPPYGS